LLQSPLQLPLLVNVVAIRVAIAVTIVSHCGRQLQSPLLVVAVAIAVAIVGQCGRN
jgi:hypothetical protein